MDFTYLYPVDLDRFSQVLAKFAKLLIWAAVHSEFTLAQSLFLIFDTKLPIHTQNLRAADPRYSEPLNRFLRTFFDNRDYEPLTSQLTTESVTLEQFDI
jgi:hypothetical protein